MRHAGLHGRPRRRGAGAGPPRQPPVRGRREPLRPLRDGRPAQGLRPGRQAMAGGGFKRRLFSVAWPTGEFGGMNLEGAVRLGYRRELDAIADPAERRRLRRHQAGRADRARQSPQRRHLLRVRRRHRPRRHPPLDRRRLHQRPRPRPSPDETPLRRHLVSQRSIWIQPVTA